MSILSKIFKSDASLITVRVLEFSLSVVVLGLLGFTVSTFNNEKTNFGVATAAISLFYLLGLYLSLFAINKYIVAAVVGFWENSVMLLWFCAFIVLAKDWGSGSCSADLFEAKKCRTAQASIAFAGVEFFLFLWSAVVFDIEVFTAIFTSASRKLDVFKTNKALTLEFSKLHGCTLSTNPYVSSSVEKDLETGAVETQPVSTEHPAAAVPSVASTDSAPSHAGEPKDESE